MTPRLLPTAFVLLVSSAFATARAEEGTATTTATTTTSETKVSKVDSPLKPEAPVGDVQDVVFFGDQQPVFIRLHIESDGKGFETSWMDAMRRLHKYLDTDGDGKLSTQERDKGGWLQRLRNPAPRRGQPAPAPAQMKTQTVSASSVETADDVAEYLRPTFGPFQIVIAGRSDQNVESLFDHLDLDHDKKLSRAELEAADASLRKLDADDDEMIAAEELVPYQNPYYGRQNRPVTPANTVDNAPFTVLAPGESRIKLVRRLISRYDAGSDKDNKLSQTEIGLDQAAFERADGDGDGGLDSDEMLHFLARPTPELELNVKSGKRISQSKVALADSGGGSPAMVPFLRKTGEGTLDLLLETVQVEFNPDGAQQGRVDAKQFYENQFRQADGDNNKYLDMNEARRFGVFDDQTFKMMDRDSDGKLFKEEMDAFIDQDTSISSSRTLLTVVDHGRSFFDVLDVDRNRRLSVRELRAALKKVASWDRNGDGLVAADEIPAHFKVAFGPGQSSLLDRFNFGVGFNQNMRNGAVGSRQAPAWFQKMDHNKDGDLSPREFLGSRADFQRIDADHDGLIDPKEAEKAGK